MNKTFAVICLISDAIRLRAFGGDPEERSKNKVGEAWYMKKPQRELDQSLEMKTVKRYGHSNALLKILVPNAERFVLPEQKICKNDYL